LPFLEAANEVSGASFDRVTALCDSVSTRKTIYAIGVE